MHWWTSWFRRIDPGRGWRALCALGLGLACTWPARAQEGVDQQYKQALDFFNSARMEEACDLFQQVEKAKPGYMQTEAYLGMACDQVKRLRKIEEDSFNACVELFNQGQLDDARIKCNQAVEKAESHLKTPRYRSQILDLLKKIDSRKQEQARKEQAEREQKQKERAQKERTEKERAQRELAGKEQAQKQQPSASEQVLRAGLKAYLDGKLDEAEQDLSDYLSHKGQKQSLAYFFRGAARSTLYFLSGEKDAQQKELALADFRAVRDQGDKIQPPQKYVSPKILALYFQAAGELSQ
jgi:hypothetical protein